MQNSRNFLSLFSLLCLGIQTANVIAVPPSIYSNFYIDMERSYTMSFLQKGQLIALISPDATRYFSATTGAPVLPGSLPAMQSLDGICETAMVNGHPITVSVRWPKDKDTYLLLYGSAEEEDGASISSRSSDSFFDEVAEAPLNQGQPLARLEQSGTETMAPDEIPDIIAKDYWFDGHTCRVIGKTASLRILVWNINFRELLSRQYN